MNALLVIVNALFVAAFGSNLYLDPSGVSHVMRPFIGARPAKRESTAQGNDFPYILTKLDGFALTRDSGMRYTVSTEIGVYTTGDEAAGALLVDGILTKVKDIAMQRFSPYKLVGEITGTLSDETNHPYYQITLEMNFRA